MQLNKYYYVCFSLIVLSSFCLWWADIRPKAKQSNHLHLTETKLQDEIYAQMERIKDANSLKPHVEILMNRVKLYSREKNASDAKTEMYAALLQAFAWNKISLLSMDVAEWRAVSGLEMLTFHIVAEGQFFSFYAFLKTLTRYSLPFYLSGFTLQSDRFGKLAIDMHISGFYLANPTSRTGLPKWQLNNSVNLDPLAIDPFIDATKVIDLTNLEPDFDPSENVMSWRSLKGVGHMRLLGKTWGLVKWENGKTSEMYKGLTFGAEKVKVVDVTPLGITILVDNLKHVIKFQEQ